MNTPNNTSPLHIISYRFLQSVEGGSKKPAATLQEVVDLSKFLHLADPTSCNLDNVTQMQHVVKYLNGLRNSGVGPSGQITKLQTLQNAVKMLVISVPDDGGDDQTKDMVVRSKVIETKLRGICKSLRKECSVIRLQKRDMFDGGSDLRDQVLIFLNDPRLEEVVTGYVRKDEVNDGELLMMRRYLMCCLIFKNAQRQGPAVNLRVKEVQRAVSHRTKSGENVFIYKVCP